MKVIGRDLKANVLYNMFRTHTTSSIIQGIQKLRQISKIDYNFSKNGKGIYPIIITLEITHRCNLRCRTCWFWGKHGKYSGGGTFEEMSLDEIRRFIDSIVSFRPYLLITGGEPLLYPRIEEVIKYASKRGLFVGLITNGMLSNEKKISEVISAGVNFITISLDGPNGKVHNYIRNNKDSFKNCLRTIKIIKKLKGKKYFPILTVNLTISKYNYNKLNGILKLIEKLSPNILQFQHQWFTDSKNACLYAKWAKENLNINSDYIGTFETCAAKEVNGEKLYDELKKIKQESKIYVRIFPDLTRKETIEYYHSMKPLYNKFCINPWFGTYVKPNGDVVPCIDYVIGNVKKDDFKKIWNSDRMKNFRRIVRKQKYFPGCTRCCGFFQK